MSAPNPLRPAASMISASAAEPTTARSAVELDSVEPGTRLGNDPVAALDNL